MVSHVESNVLCAASLLVTATTLDALCALPASLNHENVPSSLRTTSLVLSMLLASPVIGGSHKTHTEKTPPRSRAIEQRGILTLLLCVAVFFSNNRCSVGGRNADAICTLLGTSAILFAAVSNGATNADGDLSEVQKSVAKEHGSAIVGSLLVYCGIRTVRHAMLMPSEALSFRMEMDDFATQGVSHASHVVATAHALSGSLIAGFGALVLANHDLVFVVGSSGLSRSAAAISTLLFASVLVAQLDTFATFELLPALFGDGACNGDVEVCGVAFRARRHFVSLHSSSLPFACCLAIAAYAFCSEKQQRSRSDSNTAYNDPSSLEGISLIGSTIVCIVAAIYYIDVINPSFADLEMVLLLVSIPLALFNMPVLSGVTHGVGQAIYFYDRISKGTFSFLFFTNISMALSIALILLIVLATAASFALYSLPEKLYVTTLEKITSFTLTSLLSVQVFLTLATCGMASGATGASYDGVDSWRNSGVEYLIQHQMSVFFAGALYAVRYEHASLSKAWRAAAYFTPPFFVGITWLIVMQVEESDVVYSHWVDAGSFIIGCTASAVSWIGLGLFLHL